MLSQNKRKDKALQIRKPILSLVKRLCAIMAGASIISLSSLGFIGTAHGSGSDSLSLTTTSTGYHTGDTFQVTIHESNSDIINAVEADLTYDSSKLQFVSLSGNSAAFDLSVPASGGGGKVSIPEASSSGINANSDLTVGTVTFQVLGGSGSTRVNFDTTSFIALRSDSSNVWVCAANPSTLPACASNAGLSINLLGSGGTTPSPSPTPPAPTPSGTTKKTTPSPSPSPSTSTSTSGSSSSSGTTQSTSATTGYLVAIKVTDASGNPVSGATVDLDGTTAQTLKNGLASFPNVSSGGHTVTVTVGSTKSTQSITVDPNQPNLQLQQFSVKVAGSKQQNYFWIIGILLALVAIAGGGWTVGQSLTHRHVMGVSQVNTNQATPPTPTIPPAPTVPVNNGQPVTETNPLKQVFYPQPTDQSTPSSNDQDQNNG